MKAIPAMIRLLTALSIAMAASLSVVPAQVRRNESSPRALTSRQVAARVLPSVVLVVVKRGEKVFYGSGFVIAADTVITSRHVVEGTRGGHVQIAGQTKRHPFTSVFPDTQNDLALLRVQGLGAPSLSTGEDRDLAVGDDVYVAGNPKGYEGTFSRGIVSGVRPAERLIQFDAAVSPGSSGGPLVDENGHVVGVVRSYSDGQNLNFAVPVAYVNRLLAAVRRNSTPESLAAKRSTGNPSRKKPLPMTNAIPQPATARWLTVTGKNNDFTIEFPAKPLHEYKEPHLLSNKRIEEYLHCAEGFCLYAASLKFESGIQNATAQDQIAHEADEVPKLTREAHGWKTTRVTKLSADSYEVEGLAPWVGSGVLAPIIQRVIERNGQTYKLECRVMPGRGELDGDDREVCKRFLDSFRPSVILQSPQPPQSSQPTKP